MFVVTVFIHDGKISNITLFSKTYKIRNRGVWIVDTRLPQPKNLAGRRPTLRERHWAREALDGGLAPKGLSPKILGLAAPQARKFEIAGSVAAPQARKI